MLKNKQFSWTDLFSDFEAREIDTEELENIIVEVVGGACPDQSIEDIQYSDEGIEVVLDNGEAIFIDVDWNEIILT